MSEHWDIYFSYIEDKVASIVLDMEVFEEINTEEYNYAHCLRVHLKEPNEDGLPIGAEAEKLGEIEESIIEFLEPQNFINVGRVSSDGIRDIIFYSGQEMQDAVVEAAERFMKPVNYEVEIFNIEEDENWGFYFHFLYPNQYEQQHMGNQHVVDSLENSGDKLEVARKVEHWVYFDDKKMMKRFAEAVIREGFSIEMEKDEMTEEGKYMLAISRVDSVDLQSINEVTDLLVETSEKFEGEYDGWETLVIEG